MTRAAWVVPGVVALGALVALACGPGGEPTTDPKTPANSPVPTHFDTPEDPSGSPKAPDAG